MLLFLLHHAVLNRSVTAPRSDNWIMNKEDSEGKNEVVDFI